MSENKHYHAEFTIPAESEYTYLCTCIDHRFFEAILAEYRELTGNHFVYLETEMGGAPSFGTRPRSAEEAYENPQILARKMGWAAHGSGCAGFPGRPDEAMRAKLAATVAERRRDFPLATHFALFAFIDHGKVVVDVTELPPEEASGR